jgi:pSer/pThr/pTyr-binding forkhead associated (FHA) protein
MWVLEATDEAGIGRVTFRMAPGAIKTIGRTTGADFILDAALVSRLHCRLSATEPCVEVVDLDSTNGTFVNGERVTRAAIKPGDRLRVGRVDLKVSRSNP